MFNAVPQPLDKEVVQPPPASVHADGNSIPLEHARERRARELRSLVGVDDLRLVVQPKGIFYTVGAKQGVHFVADSPSEHPARIPVDHRHQIHEATFQPDSR